MRLLSLALCALLMLVSANLDAAVYELRIYTCSPGKLDALHTRFREHTLRIFEKHGMKNIAYWVPTDGPEAETTLYYILEHKSLEAAKASWAAFQADPEWKKVAADSAAAHGKILADRPVATYMTPTDYSPAIAPVPHDKIYELRTYVAAEGKLGALDARFRDHTYPLLSRHGLRAIGYWVPVDTAASKNTLIYLLQHDTRAAADANWAKFRQDPDWATVVADSEKDGKLLAGRLETVFLKTVDYSPKPAH
jgi:hypothetical protein